MIRYALGCDSGHNFDGWFRSSDDFDAQAARGLLSCPVCGSEKVAKALMAPAIGRSDPAGTAREAVAEQATATPAPEGAEAAAPVALLSERDQELRTMIRAFREKLTANAENVGDKFAETARQMHNEEIDKRSIYGRATPEEAKALHEEGVEFQPLPSLPEERG